MSNQTTNIKMSTRDEAKFCLMGFCINPKYMVLDKTTWTATLKPGKANIFGYGVFKHRDKTKSSFYVGIPGSTNGWFQRVMWKRIELHESKGKKQKTVSLFNLHMIADMGNDVELRIVLGTNAFFAQCLSKLLQKKPEYQLEFRFIENGDSSGGFLATPSAKPFMRMVPIVFKDNAMEGYA